MPGKRRTRRATGQPQSDEGDDARPQGTLRWRMPPNKARDVPLTSRRSALCDNTLRVRDVNVRPPIVSRVHELFHGRALNSVLADRVFRVVKHSVDFGELLAGSKQRLRQRVDDLSPGNVSQVHQIVSRRPMTL